MPARNASQREAGGSVSPQANDGRAQARRAGHSHGTVECLQRMRRTKDQFDKEEQA